MSLPAPAEAPILERLRSVGFDVESLSDLRHSGVRYINAVPALVAALSADLEPRTLEEVVRALSVPWAKPAATGPMVEVFRTVRVPSGTSLDSLRWAVGNALYALWDNKYFDELVDLVRERSYGRDREMVVLGFARSKRPEAGDVLLELLDDPDVNGHAVKALAKLRIPHARAGLERMAGDSRAWVRRAAESALSNLA